MILRKFSLVIALLFSMCFVNAQIGTTIKVKITNYAWDSYDISIMLDQTSVTPTSGSLTYTITPQTSTLTTLVFDETDICIDKIKATYNGTCDNCSTSVVLDVDCTNFTNDYTDIAPFMEGCYEFEYTDLNIINYGEKLDYEFEIHQ